MTFHELEALLRDEVQGGSAGVCGLETPRPAALRVVIETVPGRSHVVWLLREADGDGEVARIVAPAAKIPKGRELAPDAARALLRRNASLSAGALAIASLGDEENVSLVLPLRLASSTPTEILLSIVRAANAADAFEESLGGIDAL
ncbi:MAG: YbjN domain-containing protein [Myxococcota bacterium]|nr:YbjN domain-containing protein [Myxococcota bacterium]